jgi:Zn/Cd-binding protein ZinT
MLFLSLLFSCDDTTIAPQFHAEEISLDVKYQEMEKEIKQVLQDWEDGKSQEVQDRMLSIYQGSFQELQPIMAQNDQLGLIKLEFTFGQTLERMKSLRSKGRKEQSEKLLHLLSQQTEFLRANAKEEKTPEKTD